LATQYPQQVGCCGAPEEQANQNLASIKDAAAIEDGLGSSAAFSRRIVAISTLLRQSCSHGFLSNPMLLGRDRTAKVSNQSIDFVGSLLALRRPNHIMEIAVIQMAKHRKCLLKSK
jgi:hypothetical protein